MKFNIKIHILDHATYTINDLSDSYKPLVHFNTSVCQTYFLRQGIETQEKIDDIMINILKKISHRTILVKEKNGTYTKKDGKVIQRYRTRTISFSNLLSAYHSQHFDSSKSVNPHFHFLFPTNARMGKDFLYLKQALKEEADKHKIKFNFMEEKQNTGLSKKQLYKIESLSWIFNQGNTNKIKKYYLSNTNRLTEALDLLHMHYRSTQNISYFLKNLSILNQRLQELDIDFIYKNLNLKENIYFFLNQKQKNMLESLASGRNVELDLSQVIDREILKYSHGFKSDAIDILSKKFNLELLSPKQLLFHKKHEQKNSKEQNNNTFRKLIIDDLRNALVYANSEKDWKNILLKMGYMKISINSSKSSGKRVKTAITVITKKRSKVSIPFYSMRLNFKKITQIMMHNKKKNRKKEDYSNRFDAYKKRKKREYEIWKKYTIQMQLLLKIYNKNHTSNKEVDKILLKKLAEKYTIDISQMYKITTYQNQTTTIVDNVSAITLKKSSTDMGKTISDMLDIAILKGWSLTSLIIHGSQNFVNEVKTQIQRRLKPDKGDKQESTMNYTLNSNLKI